MSRGTGCGKIYWSDTWYMTATGVTATGVTHDATGVTSDLQGHRKKLSNELERGGIKYLWEDVRAIYRSRGKPFDQCGARSGSPQ